MENKNSLVYIILALILIAGLAYFIGYSRGKASLVDISQLPDEVLMRSGKVQKIEGNNIFLESPILGAMAGSDGVVATEILTVVADDSTNISKPYDPKLSNPALGARTASLKLEDIKTDSFIYAFSLKNIRDKKQFKADKITILR